MRYAPLAHKTEKYACGKAIPALPRILAGEQAPGGQKYGPAMRRSESVSSGMHMALHTCKVSFPAIPSCGARIGGGVERVKPAGAQKHVVQVNSVMQMLNGLDVTEQHRQAVQSCIVNGVTHMLLASGRTVQFLQKDFLSGIAGTRAADWLYLFSAERMESFVLRKFPVKHVILHVPRLQALELAANGLVQLDISQCCELTALSCTENGLAELTLRAMPHLRRANLQGNRLTRVVISGCAALEAADLRRNPLESIKIDGADALRRLEMDFQRLVHFAATRPVQELLSAPLPEPPTNEAESAHTLVVERLQDQVFALQDQIYALQMAEETAREEAAELRTRAKPQDDGLQARKIRFLKEYLGEIVARYLGRGE